ncbi:transposase (plasmid) [Deinococcus taeanensis]|uniref:transposase n=1 Tax=Deinococcus taeanensis TaxID=2737050 RepID=UPI001CDD3207|nr:transposase [Deinococcus taeanensis]UBV44640.1 transposase [Deinococcus taeanensis]
MPLGVCAVRVYVATLEQGRHAMVAYAQRWKIELLFKYWKSSGFEWEATHLVHTDRINTLLCVVSIASVWAWHVGAIEHEQAPIRVLAHGRLAISIVRYGLNILKPAFVNLLWNPAPFAPHLPPLRPETVTYLLITAQVRLAPAQTRRRSSSPRHLKSDGNRYKATP